jgi:dTDP-4-amino-4,6-dideoxygalactose transaminase
VAGDAALAERMRRTRDARGTGLDEAVGAVVLAELRGADEELAARRQLAWELTFDLRGMRALSGMAHSRWVVHGYDCYTIRLRALLWKRSIADTVAALNEAGVTARIALGESLHRHTEVKARLGSDERAADDAFPVATRLPGELITVPLHGGMTDASIGAIAAALKQLEQEST